MIDWSLIHERLDAVREAIERSSAPSAEDELAILKARAQALAVEIDQPADASELLAAVQFDLAGERYAFELPMVREVSLPKDLTPVPCTPPFIAGIMNLRGEIITVIDVKKLFDLPVTAGAIELNRIIIIRHAGTQLGVLADAILGVRSVPRRELQPSLATLSGVRADFLRGVTADRLILLDAAKILSDPRIVVYEEVEG